MDKEIREAFERIAMATRPRIIQEIKELESLGKDASHEIDMLTIMDDQLDRLNLTFHKTRH